MFIAIALFAAAAQQTPAADPPKDAADPVVCQRQESEVGTHMRPKPVCMKKSDWDLVEKHTQRELHSLGERSSFDPGRADGHRPQ